MVSTRPGERRVVPVDLRNTWHRERTLTVGLGSFTADGCGPDPRWVVRGEVTPSGEVTLAPCSHTTLEIVLEVGPAGEPPKGKADQAAAALAPAHERAATFYADLSLAGCARAQRLAVVVLPAHCGAHHLTPSACCC